MAYSSARSTGINLKAVERADEYAILDFGSRKQKIEFGYGSSFLSQGSRFIALSPGVKACTIVNTKGEKRNLNF